MKLMHRQGDPKSLTLLAENARYMRHETFALLVKQVKEDGVLQQWPFVYYDQATGVRTVLSGNHRVQAAITADLTTIDWTECDEPLTVDERRRIQLAHNAIVGEDDPEMLKRIYDSIIDVEDRLATGLDDAQLDLLFQATTQTLSEVNLDFTSVSVVFLPPEFVRALTAFDDAKRMASADHLWIARHEQHTKMLDAIEDARESSHVMNVATALDVLLDLWDRHREDLRENWLSPAGELHCAPKSSVPVTSILGTRVLTAEQGAILAKAVDKMVAREKATDPMDALVKWANVYLST